MRPDDVDPAEVAEAKLERDERQARAIAEGERRIAERDAGRAELAKRSTLRTFGRRGYSRRQLARMADEDNDRG